MPCGYSKESCNQDKNGENGHCAFEDLDHSVLQQPLNLGVTSVKQILKCVQSGSKEVKDIVLNECNIIYECKACDGLFRSLANFLYHKRCYCKKHLCESMVLFEKFEEEEEIVVVNPEQPVETPEKNSDNCADVSNLTNCTVNLVKTEVAKKMESSGSNTPKGKATVSGDKAKAKPVPEKTENSMISRRTRNKNAQPSVKIVSTEEPPVKCAKIASARIMRKDSGEKSTSSTKKESSTVNANKDVKSKKISISKFPVASDKNVQAFPKVVFKSIDSNPHAVYQSSDKKKLSSFGVARKAAVESEVEKDKLIIVLKKDAKPDSTMLSKSHKSEMERLSDFHLTRRKRLMSRNDCNVQELRCLTCKTQFMSLKTLYFHMLSLHSKKRLYYPCPFCKTLFVQMYGVTRHLISIHNKTKEQINKMRDVIKKKSVWKRIDDVNPAQDSNISPLNYQIQTQPQPEVQEVEAPKPVMSVIAEPKPESDSSKSVIKLGENVTLHQCAKCNRVFGRKSSQVSHEKFCIMSAPIKLEPVDDPPLEPMTPTTPVVSFLALPQKPAVPKPTCVLQITKPENTQVRKPSIENRKPSIENRKPSVENRKPSIENINHSDIRPSIRPKRGAEKQMHKDFVNSQTLKWRSANRVDTTINNKTPPPVKKKASGKNLEKRVHSFMNSESLTCMKCNKKFSSYSNLRRHVAIHVGWTRFKCKYCDYQAYNKSQCWAHVQKAHAVEDDDMETYIVNLVNSSSKKNSQQNSPVSSKRNVEASPKSVTKSNSKVKIKTSKKKIANNSKNVGSEKKQTQLQKKEQPEVKKEVESEPAKQVTEVKKEKIQTLVPFAKFAKKDIMEIKEDKPQATITFTKVSKKEEVDGKDKPPAILTFQKISKKEIFDTKKEKTQHVIPIHKLTVQDIKKDTSYKSVTTSNPTTIILSKRIQSSTVSPIVTISSDTMSSQSKISSIRTSPRKSDIKSPEDKIVTTLVARSPLHTKITPIQIKLQEKSSSCEAIPKDSSDQNCPKKERLISEWFPKKDLSSTTIRRDSAPLIIGLVPASNAGGVNARSKNSAIAFEKRTP